MKNMKRILLMATLAIVALCSFKTEVLAKTTKINKVVSVSEDGQSLKVAQPKIAWDSDQWGIDDRKCLRFKWSDYTGSKMRNTVDYTVETELYNAKTGKLIKSNSNYIPKGGISQVAGVYTPGAGGKFGFYEIKNLTKTPYYVRLRVTATDPATGLTGTSKWSKKLYYVPGVKLNIKKCSETNSSIKLVWNKSKVKGVSGYTIYIKKYKSKTWTKVATTKKTSYTIKKCGKSKINLRKYDYKVKVTTNMKLQGATRRTPELACDVRCWY